MRHATIALVALTLLAPAGAAAAPTKGRYFLPNHGSTKMTAKRAERLLGRVVRRVYKVKPGTGISACDPGTRSTAGCNFAFLSKAGEYTCGVALVNANKARIKVRYAADTGRCPG